MSGARAVERVTVLLGGSLELTPFCDRFEAIVSEELGALGIAVALRETGWPEPLYGAALAGWSAEGFEQALSIRRTRQDRAAIYFPLICGNETLGALAIVRGADAVPDSLWEVCAGLLALRIRDERLERAKAALEQLSLVDGLTAIWNRRFFDERLAHEWSRGTRNRKQMSVLMIDIDLFKGFNDRLGHPAGDECLRRVAMALRSCIARPDDVVARYGGEEFAAVLPETPSDAAIAIAERMREAVDLLDLEHPGSQLGCVSVSIGVATDIPTSGHGPVELLEAADHMLYVAKARGRHRVVADGYESVTIAATERFEIRHNLPIALTRFIGRTRELGELRDATTQARIVTVTGAGGVGKTRLAFEAAASLADSYRDGVLLVQFAPLGDTGQVAQAVASALGVRAAEDETLEAAILKGVRARQALLVFDNCEHVLDAIAPLAHAILSRASGVRILATSRQPLDIAGERLYRAPPLDDAHAVELLVDRARLAGAHVLPVDDACARICSRLDGIPMAIELAAARLDGMTPEQLELELRARFDVLQHHDRAALPRYQTLRALVDWSYDLLGEEERKLFRALSCLAGSFSRGAATAVHGSDVPLDGLHDKSLIERYGTGRFRLLESLREYAAEQLEACGESGLAFAKMARYYATLMDEAERAWAEAPLLEWIASTALEIDNIRAAIAWALTDEHDIELGSQLAASAMRIWTETGREFEIERYVRDGLRHAAQLEAGTRAHLLLSLARIANMQSAQGESLRASSEALRLYREVRDEDGVIAAMLAAGGSLGQLGRSREAIPMLEEALALARAKNARRAIAQAAISLGIAYYHLKDYATAIRFNEETLAIARELRHDVLAAHALNNLGGLTAKTGDVERGVDLLHEAMAIYQRMGIWTSMVRCGIALARHERLRGDYPAARHWIRQVVEWLRPVAPTPITISCLDVAARIALTTEPERAARIAGFSQALSQRLFGDDLSTDVDREEGVAAIRASLTPEAFERNMRLGSAATLAEMFEEALAA